MSTRVQERPTPLVAPVPPVQRPPVVEARPIDELANLLTHGLGLVLSIIGSVVLLRLVENHHDSRIILGTQVYCASLVGLYGASTLSHAFHDLRWRRFFRMWDQAFIFVLIAGSFTPYATVYLMEGYWPWLLAAMWFFALVGVASVLRVGNLSHLAKVAYGILGWLPVLSLNQFVKVAPVSLVYWVLAGGVFYSVGTVFLAYDRRLRYLHALWHAFVIAGSMCHYVAIMLMVT